MISSRSSIWSSPKMPSTPSDDSVVNGSSYSRSISIEPYLAMWFCSICMKRSCMEFMVVCFWTNAVEALLDCFRIEPDDAADGQDRVARLFPGSIREGPTESRSGSCVSTSDTKELQIILTDFLARFDPLQYIVLIEHFPQHAFDAVAVLGKVQALQFRS